MRRITILLACISLLLVPLLTRAAGGPPDGPPKEWEAHPPIHTKNAPLTAPAGYSPAQVRHAYGFDTLTGNGAGQVIGIVDAYDDPTAAKDLQTFITQFGAGTMHGLTDSCTVAAGPHPCFQKVFAQPGKTKTDAGWVLETSLDVQWSHAIAPGADILLVEAQTASFANLLGAVDTAVSMKAKAVSMSWGGSEFSSEAGYDFHFNKPGVTFLASSGDSGVGTIYPAISPYVVSVGGTTLPLDASGNLQTGKTETAWQGSGGGVATYESEPGFQTTFPITFTSGKRANPDVAYNADPATGFSVIDTTPYNGRSGWYVVGGTSAGSPQWAALIALVNQSRTAGSLSSNSLVSSPEYSAGAPLVYAANYRDIVSGTNGTCGLVCTAVTGYDAVTGLGSPRGNTIVPYLQTH